MTVALRRVRNQRPTPASGGHHGWNFGAQFATSNVS